MKFKDLFLLSWRNLWVVVVLGLVSILLHNLIYGLFGFEEAFFFIVVIFLLSIYVLLAIVYSIIFRIREGKMIKYWNKKVKKMLKQMEWYDMSFVKLSVFFATLFILTGWPAFHDFVMRFDWYWYLILMIVFAVPVMKKMG